MLFIKTIGLHWVYFFRYMFYIMLHDCTVYCSLSIDLCLIIWIHLVSALTHASSPDTHWHTPNNYNDVNIFNAGLMKSKKGLLPFNRYITKKNMFHPPYNIWMLFDYSCNCRQCFPALWGIVCNSVFDLKVDSCYFS